LPFEQVNPKKLIFNTLNGDRIECNGLSLHNGTYKIYKHESLDLIDIPLGNGQFYLSLIIPNKFNDINKLVEKLDPATFDSYLDKTDDATDDLLLPDFKINSEIRLKGLFPEFGLTGPLEVIKGYYFTQNLLISDFIHKTHFALGDISEENTTDFQTVSYNPEYIVDKPFILVIREKFTGAMVFTGKMIVPIDNTSK